MKVAITGATGFVGQQLCKHLRQQSIAHTPFQRKNAASNSNLEVDYNDLESLKEKLRGHDTLVQLIGKAHAADSLDDINSYRETNVELTRKIATAAISVGIRHIIYISSIKAFGEGGDTPYNINTAPEPTTAYGISKLEAEQMLTKLCNEHAIQLTVFRPPLIYNKDAKGNISTLLRALKLGLPLPFKGLDNQRSLISLHDLCESIIQEIESSDPSKLVLPVSDTCSTAQLIQRIAQDNALKPRLFSLPPPLLKSVLTLIGKRKDYQKLCGNLTATPSAQR